MTKADAVRHFGGMTELAAALGVSYQAVFQWDVIPMRRQYEIERITKGVLKADAPAASRVA